MTDVPPADIPTLVRYTGTLVTDPPAFSGVGQLYVVGGELKFRQSIEDGGAITEVSFSAAEVFAFVFENRMSWRWDVLSTLTIPPAPSGSGNRHLVGVGATGAWSGEDNRIAVDDPATSTWLFTRPPATGGWRLYDQGAAVWKLHDGAVWTVEVNPVAIWERVATTLSPVNAGDDLDLEDGDLQNVARITGGGAAQTIIEGDSTSGDSLSLRGSSGGVTPALNIVDADNVAIILEKASGEKFVIRTDDIVPIVLLETIRGLVPRMPSGLDMDGSAIVNLLDPSNPQEAASKAYVDTVVQGIDWQESVLDKDLSAPPAPTLGNRYIVATGGSGAWSGHDDEIATGTGAGWTFEVPDPGFATYVEDEDKQWVWSGAAWVKFGSIISHDVLQDVSADDHHVRPVTATETVEGIAELATQAEVDAGVSADRIVTPATLAATPFTLDRFFGYITSTIPVGVAGAYQDIDLDVQPIEQGISWDAGDSEIDLLPNATYMVSIAADVDKTTGVNSTAEIRALLNGTEIAGSAMARLLAANNQVASLSSEFAVVTPAGTPKLKLQFGGTTTNTRLVPGAAIATTKPSLQITITRVA